ncbi:hypothetical protein RMATCC62417_10178 [Rhizopus microsporus]|nr:hypothetical protein RMATCC62417_10178 [Rhizopus microsporus]
MATRYNAKQPKAKDPSLSDRTVIKKDEKGLSNAETRELTIPNDFLFAGTDNGLVKMTTSVPLSLQRAKFHLKLYNYYAALENAELVETSQLDLNDEEKYFLNLPKIIGTSAGGVDLGCGYYRQRKRLERKKKETVEGKEIQLLEDAMSKASTDNSASTITGLSSKLETNFGNRDKTQAFYDSAKNINQQRHIEIQKARYCHKLCRKERLKLIHTARNTSLNHFVWLLMCIVFRK